MTKRSYLNLSTRERQIMDILYRFGQASAAEVQANMPDPPAIRPCGRHYGSWKTKGTFNTNKTVLGICSGLPSHVTKPSAPPSST